MEIINATPHPVDIVDSEQKIIRSFPPSGILPRLVENSSDLDPLDGIPITSKSFGEIQNLPEEREEVYYIVSALVFNAAPDRHDLLVPNVVRDSQGKIVGASGFSRIAKKVFNLRRTSCSI